MMTVPPPRGCRRGDGPPPGIDAARRRGVAAAARAPRSLDAIAATACRWRATRPRREKKNEPKRRAGTWGAPFGYLALFWTLAAFSFCWRAAQSEAERPSGTYLGVFKYRERARVRGQLNGDERQPSRVETLIYSGSILCSCARAARPRATASQRCFFHAIQRSRRAARGPAALAPRVGGAPGREAAQ